MNERRLTTATTTTARRLRNLVVAIFFVAFAPRWLAAEEKFKCPCHGSGYYKSGLNFEGPAPRPMDRFKVDVNETGQLVVDKATVFKMQPGVEPDEQFPQSILKV